MPPRRGSPPVRVVVELQNELMRVQARMEAMDGAHRREPDIGHVSEVEDTRSSEEG